MSEKNEGDPLDLLGEDIDKGQEEEKEEEQEEEIDKDDPSYWRTIEGGNDTAISSYQVYRDMGAGRTLQKVADQLEVGVGTVRMYSSRHGFIDRVKAYEKHRSEFRAKAQEEAIIKAEEVLVSKLEMLLNVAIEGAITGDLKNAQGAMLRDLMDRAGLDVVERRAVELGLSEGEIYGMLGIPNPNDD